VNLEQELRALAIEFPPEPDLRGAVLARLERRPRVSWRLAIALAALAVVGALFAIPQTRAAILDFFQIGSVRIERVETQPRAPTGVFLGEKVSLAEARDAVAIDLAVPDDYRAVYVDGAFVTFELRRGVYLTQWGGNGATILRKEAGPDTRFEEVFVDDANAIWVEGAEHVVFRGPNRRIAGNVLIWERGPITYRLEGAEDLERAMAIARNLERP
jgi:hypothetical protein